jgi:gliding motility-associated-like protein
MKPVFYYLLLFLLILSARLTSQSRFVINNNPYLIIQGGVFFVVDNANANAITTLTAGNIVSEGETNRVKWNIGTNTGSYLVPFTTSTHVKIPLSLTITTAGAGAAGHILFSTYETTADDNTSYPLDVTNMSNTCVTNHGLSAVDRFWMIDAQSYTSKPTPQITIGYNDAANEIGGTNTINEVNLKAERFNTTTNLWESPAKLYGTANAVQNTVSGVTVTPADFYRSWTLVDERYFTSLTLTVTATPGSICSGGNSTLTATGANSYTWAPAATLNTLSGPVAVANPTANTTYTVLAINSNGCSNASAPATVSVTIIATPGLIVNSPTICAGQAATLSVSGASSYTWNTGSNLSTITISPVSSSAYSVVGTTTNNCTAYGTATVNLVNYPVINNSSISNITCNGLNNGSITINATGATTFSWAPPVSTTYSATNLPAGVFTATLSTGPSCDVIKTYTISQPAAIVAGTSLTNTSCGLCNGMASAEVSGGTGAYQYSWLPVNQSQKNITNLCANLYTLTVTDANNCQVSYPLDIKNSPVFKASIQASATEIYEGEAVGITAGTGNSFAWSPSAFLNCSTCHSVVAKPLQDMTYCVEVINAIGCKDKACIDIVIKCGDVFVPNAFSPNQDGYNDELKVYGNCIEEMVFRIYNRWGELVFESIDPSNTWDGNFKGEHLNSGVFVYQLVATLSGGKNVTKKGNITILK